MWHISLQMKDEINKIIYNLQNNNKNKRRVTENSGNFVPFNSAKLTKWTKLTKLIKMIKLTKLTKQFWTKLKKVKQSWTKLNKVEQSWTKLNKSLKHCYTVISENLVKFDKEIAENIKILSVSEGNLILLSC